MHAVNTKADDSSTSVPVNAERKRESGWTTLNKVRLPELRVTENCIRSPWFGCAPRVCATIMFLLDNKSRVKASRGPRELLHSCDKVNAVNAIRELSADSFRQHLLQKYSLPARSRTRV